MLTQELPDLLYPFDPPAAGLLVPPLNCSFHVGSFQVLRTPPSRFPILSDLLLSVSPFPLCLYTAVWYSFHNAWPPAFLRAFWVASDLPGSPLFVVF